MKVCVNSSNASRWAITAFLLLVLTETVILMSYKFEALEWVYAGMLVVAEIIVLVFIIKTRNIRDRNPVIFIISELLLLYAIVISILIFLCIANSFVTAEAAIPELIKTAQAAVLFGLLIVSSKEMYWFYKNLKKEVA